MTAFREASTISGFPGSFEECTRKRKPLACNARRIISSGFVFLPPIAAIILDLVEATVESAIVNQI